MREIILSGHKYPIRCSVAVDAEMVKDYNSMMDVEKSLAEEDADVLCPGDPDAREKYIEARLLRKKRQYYTDAESSLKQIAAMINAAVDYEQVINNSKSASDIFGGYPMTAHKLALIATPADLNRADNAQAVAEEMVEARTGDEKNVQAGTLAEAARTILSLSISRSTTPGSNISFAPSADTVSESTE